MIAVPLVILIVLLLIILVYYIQDDNIPGPMRIPILGNLQLCMTKPSEFIYLARHFKEVYGDAFLMYMLNEPYVFISHPKYIAPLLSSAEHTTKGRPYYLLMEWLGRGLLTDEGARWKTYRRLLTPAFHFNILQTILQVFLKNEKVFLDNLNKHADGKPFDLFPIVALMSLDNVTESIMGVPVNAQTISNSEYVKSITELSKILSLRIQNPIANMIFNFTPRKKVYDKSLETVQEITKKVIKLRRQALKDQNITSLGNESEFGGFEDGLDLQIRPTDGAAVGIWAATKRLDRFESKGQRLLGMKNKNAFLDLLLLSEVDGSKIDDDTIREQVETFMFEGHDTTASGVVFALFCLSKHEDVQQKIFDEQKEILNGDLQRDPLFAELHQMKYLEMVIKESLRLYPSVPMIERISTRDIDLGGLHIKKNTSIMVNILELQRHPELYEDPLEFRPERFNNLSKQNDKNSYNWIAFSAGPRNCIGQKFAMMELKVMVASVVKHFKLLPVDEEPRLSLELVLKAPNGVKIRLEQR